MDEHKHDPMQIREGAGLDEARLNTDLVEWLKKYSMPISVVLCGLVLGYAGLNYVRTQRAIALDTAFTELDRAQEAGSPDSLLAVADAHKGQRAVPVLARLSAADIYLRAARSGVAVAGQLNADGTPRTPEDVLTSEQREELLKQAETLYRRIVDEAQSSEGKLAAISAMFGLAAVAEMRGDTQGAAEWYTRIADRARAENRPILEKLASDRKASLDEIKDAPVLLTMADLPASAATAMPAPGSPIIGSDGSGNPIQFTPVPGPPPGVGIPGVEPAPAEPEEPAPTPGG